MVLSSLRSRDFDMKTEGESVGQSYDTLVTKRRCDKKEYKGSK